MKTLTTFSPNSRAHYNIVRGDFNAKVRPRQCMEKCTGQHALGERNQQGDMLVEFAEHHSLKIVNTLFKKWPNRCWMWISLNGETKNEIKYILTDKPVTFSDLSVLNSINMSSNHRMVWERARINTRLERAKLIICPMKIDTDKLHKHQVEFEVELWNRFNVLDAIPCDLDTTANTITKVIHKAAHLIVGRHQGKRPDKLSARMTMLWEKRIVMKTGSTTWDNLKYIQTCKAIRQEMKDDILTFDKKQSPQSHWEKVEPEACQMQAVPWQKTAHIHHGRRQHLDPQQGLHSDTLCWVLPGTIQV